MPLLNSKPLEAKAALRTPPVGIERRHLLACGATLAGALGLMARHAPATAQSPADRKPAADMAVTPTGKDQTAALQNAIDQASERGARLLLAPGDYFVSSLDLRAKTSIAAAPKARLLPASGPFGLIAREAHGLKLTGLTIDGRGRELAYARGAEGLISILGGKRIALENLALSGSSHHGIALKGVSGLVGHCSIESASSAGIFSIDAQGLEIASNLLEDCGDNGILVWRSNPGPDASIVHHNRIRRVTAKSGGTGEFGNGLNLFRAHSVIVVANRIEDCAYSAIRANAASNALLHANSISGAGEVALYIEFGYEGAVVSGNVIEDAADGIVVTNFDHGGRLAAVQGNLIRNVTRRAPTEGAHGLGIAVEADAAVTGNVIENAPTAGIFIGFGKHQRDVAATGNVIRRAKHGIAVQSVAGAGKALIASNLIAGAEGGAIRAFDHWQPVGPDLALAGARIPPQLVISQNLLS
ncbi:MAG: TIGR03808 family TAT-translocated repetitive protein [Hyphomicrobiaceae bacterium]|nr:MAG: TIGR03808 family TAT-translocated repetitive protein [Hyphomicrobiaceae bacterium]